MIDLRKITTLKGRNEALREVAHLRSSEIIGADHVTVYFQSGQVYVSVNGFNVLSVHSLQVDLKGTSYGERAPTK